MKIKPLNDRVVVLRTEKETKTAGGIIIPDAAKEKPQGEKSWMPVLAKPIRMAAAYLCR